jgi:hypothetical protein
MKIEPMKNTSDNISDWGNEIDLEDWTSIDLEEWICIDLEEWRIPKLDWSLNELKQFNVK